MWALYNPGDFAVELRQTGLLFRFHFSGEGLTLHRKAFAVSAFLFLLMMGAIAFSNYNRDWKQYQRAYYYELNQRDKEETAANASTQPQSLSFWDSIIASLIAAAQIELDLKMQKVVTDPGRTADMCMTCHVNQGSGGFDEQPLEDLFAIHPQYVIDNYPFDTYGCTACHGGQPLSLDVEIAHEALTDTIEEFFLLKVSELTAPNWVIRQKAIEKIRWMTGDDFGFSHDGSPEEIATVQEHIMTWWELHKSTFYTEGFGDRESPFKTENPLAATIEADPNLSPTGKPLEYVNNNSCIGCHTTLYQGRLRAAQEAGSAESAQSIQTQLDHIRLWADIDLSDITLADDAFAELATNYSCQMCHGPGEEYFQLMQKGYSLELQGRSIEASELLGKASEIARANARHNLSDPSVWALFQEMARKVSGIEATGVESSESDSTTDDATDAEAESTEGASSDEASAQENTDNDTDETSQDEAETGDDVLIAQGQQLSQRQGCTACHSIDGSQAVGPSWLGLYGRTTTLEDGGTVTADDTYIKNSILKPGDQIVQGYGNLMPAFDFDYEQLNATRTWSLNEQPLRRVSFSAAT